MIFEQLGLLGLFIACFLAATLVPFSSEAVVAFAISQNQNLIVVFLVALTGNSLGSVVNYCLGLKGIQSLEARLSLSGRNRLERAQRIFKKWGVPSLIMAWVPIVGDPLTLVAGLAKVDFRSFSFWVILGKALRYIAVIWFTKSLVG